MSIEHRLITDPQIHEPKGASTAAPNTIYVADGLGSGSWQPRYEDNLIFAEIDRVPTVNTLVLNTPLLLQGFTFDDSTPTHFTLTGSGSRLNVLTSGFYHVTFSINLIPQTSLGANTELVYLDVILNGVPPIAPRHIPLTITRNSDNTDSFYVFTSRIIDLSAGDYIEMYLENKDPTRSYEVTANLNMFKIGNL